MSLISIVLFAAFNLNCTTAHADDFYIDNGNQQITAVHDMDPESVKPREWQVRLYKNGMTTKGPNYWGLITGKTSEKVMRELDKGQKFQKSYAKWAGRDYQDEVFTYFNPLGPIAVFDESNHTTPRQSSERTQRISSIKDKLSGYMDDFLNLAEAIANNPNAEGVSAIGKTLKNFGKNLSDAKDKLEAFQKDLLDGNMGNSTLNEMEGSLNQAEKDHPAIVEAKANMSTRTEGWQYQSWSREEAGCGSCESSMQTGTQRMTFQNGLLVVYHTRTNPGNPHMDTPDWTTVDTTTMDYSKIDFAHSRMFVSNYGLFAISLTSFDKEPVTGGETCKVINGNKTCGNWLPSYSICVWFITESDRTAAINAIREKAQKQ